MMKKSIIKLTNLFYFSRSESRGFIVLMLFMLATAAYHYYQLQQIQQYKLSAEQLAEYKELKASFNSQASQEDTGTVYMSKPAFREIDKPKSKTTAKYKPKSKTKYQKSWNQPSGITLNQADSVDLKRVYGIGKVLSKRIIKFRDKLGGFHSKDQLAEVYGLDSLTVKKVLEQFPLEQSPAIKRLKINEADQQTLGNHPYISYKLAKVIVSYRDQHGPFSTLESLEDIVIIDHQTFLKISPYLEI